MTRELVRDIFCRHLGDAGSESLDDGAVLSLSRKTDGDTASTKLVSRQIRMW